MALSHGDQTFFDPSSDYPDGSFHRGIDDFSDIPPGKGNIQADRFSLQVGHAGPLNDVQNQTGHPDIDRLSRGQPAEKEPLNRPDFLIKNAGGEPLISHEIFSKIRRRYFKGCLLYTSD